MSEDDSAVPGTVDPGADAPQGAAPQMNPCLAEAVKNAQIMLAYATQRGQEAEPKKLVQPDVVTVVVETSSLLAKGRITAAQEARFWSALDALGKAIHPVSVTSLRATLDSFAGDTVILGMKLGRRSLARRAVMVNTWIAVVTLVLLLVAQIYWLFGSSITADIQNTNKQIAEVESRLGALRKAVSAGSAARDKPAPAEAGQAADPDIALLVAQQKNLSLRKRSSYQLLKVWSRPWEVEDTTQVVDPKSPDPEGNVARLETALIILEVFQRYLLPLLYGALGACVYVLRTLTTEIKQRTYSEASNIGHRIRLYLGMLGGMVFAWFITPETADKLFQSLSPFALAFLAGYSVELLFAAMDRFLGAFTSKVQA